MMAEVRALEWVIEFLNTDSGATGIHPSHPEYREPRAPRPVGKPDQDASWPERRHHGWRRCSCSDADPHLL